MLKRPVLEIECGLPAGASPLHRRVRHFDAEEQRRRRLLAGLPVQKLIQLKEAFRLAMASTSSDHGQQHFDEAYLLSLLSDSNLPTGGFVASSGLESYSVHGFLRQQSSGQDAASTSKSAPPPVRDRVATATIDFVRSSLQSYARSAVPFLLDAHRLVTDVLAAHIDSDEGQVKLEDALTTLINLDSAYHAFSPNHVLRRASKAQGMALLILYSKSFAPPHSATGPAQHLIDAYKQRVRASASRDAAPHGHLPVCWGVFTAALGMGAQASMSLHLFLQARTNLSSSIRLNTLGPYLAHSLLLHEVRDVVRDVVGQRKWVRRATTGLVDQGVKSRTSPASAAATASNDFARDWDWADEGAWARQDDGDDEVCAPANTWPLGDIVQARHDVLHTRLFNS